MADTGEKEKEKRLKGQSLETKGRREAEAGSW